ncbi:MAG: hypothetical protein H7196_04145 [candidate division SR1 bacterium]|nr:hypothetical protein [candidate division SR1 bacterium]
MSILLLGLGSVLLFGSIQKATYPSKAFIPDTWSVLGSNTSSQYCNGSTSAGSNLPSQFKNSGDIVAISGGVDHVLALKNDNTVKSCGNNTAGQLGDGSNASKTSFAFIPGLTGIVQIVAGNKISFALNTLGHVYQWGETVTGNTSIPVLVPGLSNIVSITSSQSTLLAVDSSSNLYGYGLNASGEAGNGNNLAIITPTIIETGVTRVRCSKEACAIIKSGSIYTSGGNSKKELASDTLPSRYTFGIVNTQRSPNIALSGIVSIASGPSSYNFYALDSSGKVWSWGDANYLGYSLQGNTNGDLARNITALTSITEISGSYPLALRASGELYTWTNISPTLINGITNTTKLNQSSGQTAYIKGNLFNPLDIASANTLNPTCIPAEVNHLTTCTFTLPLFRDLPNSLYIGIGDAAPAGNCSGSAIINCTNVPTGSVDGNSIIYIQIGNNSKVSTQGNAIVKKTIINNSNIIAQSGTCIPNTVNQGESLRCIFPLTGSTSFDIPPNGLRAAITNISGDKNSIIGPSDSCQIENLTLVCTSIPTSLGSAFGSLGTHEVVIYEPGANSYFFNKAVVSINLVTIKNSNILTSNDCVSSNIIQSGSDYNCTFALTGSVSNLYAMPQEGVVAKIATGSITSPLCVILNNGTAGVKLSCNNIPTLGITRGVKSVLVSAGLATYESRGSITIKDNILGVDLSNLNITCNSGKVNSTTICSFSVPNFTSYRELTLGVGETLTGGVCSIDGSIANCTNIPTGPDKGNQIIYAQLEANMKVNTGRTGELIKVFDDATVEFSIFSCMTANIDTITTCSFDIPQYESISSGFGIQIGNFTTASSCSVSGLVGTCSGVNTGNETGDQMIYAGTLAKVKTGETATITRPILQSDLKNFSQLVNLVCIPNPVAVFSNTICAGKFPNYITGSANFKLKISGESESSCTVTNLQIKCPNINTGSNAGDKGIQVSMNGGNFEDTGLFLTISSKIIGDNELAILGDPSKNQILSQFECGINGIVYAGKNTTCTIKAAPGWVIYPGFKMSIEIDPPTGTCSQFGTKITCIEVPVVEDTSTPGVLFLVNKSGQTIFVGVTYVVQAAPTNFIYVPPENPINPTELATPKANLPTGTTPSVSQPNSTNVAETPRTGGLNIAFIVVLVTTWILMFYRFFYNKNKIK